ncbi:hypothetical protein KC221_24575, partial [Mycobacterium tuberculosis]|nr:hypothetical protein [Mycobacterium tuberculosis]
MHYRGNVHGPQGVARLDSARAGYRLKRCYTMVCNHFVSDVPRRSMKILRARMTAVTMIRSTEM